MIRTLLALTACLVASSVSAEPRLLSGGLICDNIEDVLSSIEAARPVASCGILQGQVPAEVTHLAPFEFEGNRFLITQYDFTVPVAWGVQTQYGFWGPPVPILGEGA